MANRCYTYSVHPGSHHGFRDLGEWPVDVPPAFLILVGFATESVPSQIWDGDAPVALRGDAAAGRALMLQVLDWHEARGGNDQLLGRLGRARDALMHSDRQGEHFVLELGEIFELSGLEERAWPAEALSIADRAATTVTEAQTALAGGAVPDWMLDVDNLGLYFGLVNYFHFAEWPFHSQINPPGSLDELSEVVGRAELTLRKAPDDRRPHGAFALLKAITAFDLPERSPPRAEDRDFSTTIASLLDTLIDADVDGDDRRKWCRHIVRRVLDTQWVHAVDAIPDKLGALAKTETLATEMLAVVLLRAERPKGIRRACFALARAAGDADVMMKHFPTGKDGAEHRCLARRKVASVLIKAGRSEEAAKFLAKGKSTPKRNAYLHALLVRLERGSEALKYTVVRSHNAAELAEATGVPIDRVLREGIRQTKKAALGNRKDAAELQKLEEMHQAL